MQEYNSQSLSPETLTSNSAGSTFNDCTFSGEFSTYNFSYASFSGCTFTNATFDCCNFHGAEGDIPSSPKLKGCNKHPLKDGEKNRTAFLAEMGA